MLAQSDTEALMSPRLSSAVVSAAAPTPDHYFPLLYAVGLRKGTLPVPFTKDSRAARLACALFSLGKPYWTAWSASVSI